MKILYDNLIFGSTINALTENPDYAFNTALNDTRLTRVCRTVDDADQTIDFNLGSALGVSAVGILKHNFSDSADVELQAFTNDPLVDPTELAYTFDDDTCDDSSGNGNDGTPTNITYEDSTYGRAAVFNGTSSYIQTSPFSIFDKNSFSIVCKLNSSLASSTQNIFGQDNNSFRFRLIGGKIQCIFKNDSGITTQTATTVLQNDTDYNIYIDYNATSSVLNIYLDNNLELNVDTGAGFLSTDLINNFYVGSFNGTSEFFTGSLDEIRVFDRPLTTVERTNGYENNIWPGDAVTPDYTNELTVTESIAEYFDTETYQYWRLAIDDDNSDEYLQMSYVFLGPTLDAPGMSKAKVFTRKSNTVATKSTSGQLYSDKRLKFKAKQIAFPVATEAERTAVDSFWDEVEIARPFILLVWEDDLDIEPPFYCNLTKELEWAQLDGEGLLWTLPLEFEQCF